MAKGNEEIYGADPDGGASKIANMGLRCMKSNQSPAEAEKAGGEGTSDSKDVTGNLGQAKP